MDFFGKLRFSNLLPRGRWDGIASFPTSSVWHVFFPLVNCLSFLASSICCWLNAAGRYLAFFVGKCARSILKSNLVGLLSPYLESHLVSEQMTLWSFDTNQEFWPIVTLAICPFGLMTCSRFDEIVGSVRIATDRKFSWSNFIKPKWFHVKKQLLDRSGILQV